MDLLKSEGGLDERLAFHISSLFVRDPIPTYDHEHVLEQEDDYLGHFENL